tara:strand:- start:44 stop:277 length:234 start_codon:yes stop_codon:yes gene_type:complete
MTEDYEKTIQTFHKLSKDDFIRLRRSYGMNQIEWARFLGYTNKTYISLLENGERKISKQVAFLCNMLKSEKQRQTER